jgi:hypothetical protein
MQTYWHRRNRNAQLYWFYKHTAASRSLTFFNYKNIFAVALHQVAFTGEFFQIHGAGKQFISLSLQAFNFGFVSANVVFQFPNFCTQSIAIYEVIDIEKRHPQQEKSQNYAVAISVQWVVHLTKVISFFGAVCTEFLPVRISVLLQVCFETSTPAYCPCHCLLLPLIG